MAIKVSQNPIPALLIPDAPIRKMISNTSPADAAQAPRPEEYESKRGPLGHFARHSVVRKAKAAATNAKALATGRTLVIIEPSLTWARTLVSSLKSRKIRTSYEMR